MTTFTPPDFHLIVAVGGGRYIGLERGCVIFEDPADGYRMKLWTSWCRSPEDVAMAIKAHREMISDFPPLEKSEAL
jgi:hypothetical protein